MRQSLNHPVPVPGRAPARGRGFTLIELLVVIAVVIILIGILLVALQAATRASQRANTGALMQAIQKGLTEFKEAVGYLPPVLGPEDLGGVMLMDEFRAYKAPPDGPDPSATPDPVYIDEIQDWYSYTSIAEYLIGYGPENEDGADRAGLRSPQADGYWGVSASVGDSAECATVDPGTLEARRCFLGSDLSTSIRSGKIFGPFLELRDERLLGAIAGVDDNDEPIIIFPGEALPAGLPAGTTFDSLPKVVVDYWGKPLRYFRTLYREGALNLPYRGFDAAGQPMSNPPTLADVFVLRPWELPVGSGITSEYADDATDKTTTSELKHAQFALISSGQDRQLNDDVRRDTQTTGANSGGYNEDNLIEVAK